MVTDAKIKAMVKRCVKHLMKKKSELNLPKNASETALKCLTVYNRKNGRSWAGDRMIKINAKCWQFGNKQWEEYDRLGKTPVIGDIKVTDDDDILMCLVSHEVAHFIQFTYTHTFPQYLLNKAKKDKAHGECFQTIYRYLRGDLVNPTIKAKYQSTQ